MAYDYHLNKIVEKDATGALTGNKVELHYSAATGRLMDIQDNIGRTVTYTQGQYRQPHRCFPGLSGSATYGYSGSTNKHLLTSIDEGQGVYENTYDSTGKVTQTDPRRRRHRIRIHHSLQKDQINQHHQRQLRHCPQHPDPDRRIRQQRPAQQGHRHLRQRQGLYQGQLHAAHPRRILGKHRLNRYPNLVLKSATDYTYDSKGNALTRTDSLGNVTTWTYHPTFSKVLTETVKSVVDPLQNRVITNTYDSVNGNLLSTTETGFLGNSTSYSYTTTYTYDTNSRVASIDGPRTDVSDVTTYTYDPITGHLTAITQPLIGTTTYSSHDSLGNPQTVTDPNGNATMYTYDTTGRVLTVKAPGDIASTQYVYVSGGCTSCGNGGANKIDHITLPEGNAIWYTTTPWGISAPSRTA